MVQAGRQAAVNPFKQSVQIFRPTLIGQTKLFQLNESARVNSREAYWAQIVNIVFGLLRVRVFGKFFLLGGKLSANRTPMHTVRRNRLCLGLVLLECSD